MAQGSGSIILSRHGQVPHNILMDLFTCQPVTVSYPPMLEKDITEGMVDPARAYDELKLIEGSTMSVWGIDDFISRFGISLPELMSATGRMRGESGGWITLDAALHDDAVRIPLSEYLTETGENQCRRVGRYLQPRIDPEKVMFVSSDSPRAMRSACIVAETAGVHLDEGNFVRDTGLHEISVLELLIQYPIMRNPECPELLKRFFSYGTLKQNVALAQREPYRLKEMMRQHAECVPCLSPMFRDGNLKPSFSELGRFAAARLLEIGKEAYGREIVAMLHGNVNYGIMEYLGAPLGEMWSPHAQFGNGGVCVLGMSFGELRVVKGYTPNQNLA